MNDGQPLFRVHCSRDPTYVELENGFRGDFKKGMTLQARFIIARRSLFQLLYDKAEDWLNPSWGENEYAMNGGGRGNG
jgi:HlyD family secretion protein